MYTLGDISRKGSRLCPQEEALVFEETRVTWRQLEDRVNRLANAILKLGYRKGERSTILAENTHKYMEVYFAAAKLGMSVTPLNFRLADAELIHIANDSESVLFFAGDGYEDRSAGLKKDLGKVRQWISLDKKREGFLFYDELLDSSSKVDPLVDVGEDEMVILMYTGGTTGLPKGVMLSHRNIMTAAYAAIIGCGVTKHDIACYVLPLFHISIWPALCVLMMGGKVVITRRPELLEIAKLIQDEKCTWINMVPTLYAWMLNTPAIDEFDLSSLRLMSYAGSPIAPDVLKRLINRYGNVFLQGYGLTEAAPIVTLLPQEDHILEGPERLTRRLASAGKEFTLVEAKVVDENDQEVKPGETGEIVARGKNIMMGYWKNPELTRETLKNGWLHTGDMATIDEDGYIYLVDRKADMIVTGGENVYPKEVEDILYQHPAVLECAVVSAPDAKWGEKVQAVVTLKGGASASPDQLIAHCKGKLAGYKCPKAILIWDAIPKTTVGKILRREVKKHFWKDSDRSIG
jgi:acyl-CoA synthetase (AMP-forming)/AMP-acid ligase II